MSWPGQERHYDHLLLREPQVRFEVVDKFLQKEPGKSKQIAVIGGGPGGMRTALYLADRGHKVTIYEKEEKLGGAIKHADYIPFKWTLKDYKNYLIRQVEKKGIHVVLNTTATPEMVEDRYDAVIAAVGAQPVIPPIPGAKGRECHGGHRCHYAFRKNRPECSGHRRR